MDILAVRKTLLFLPEALAALRLGKRKGDNADMMMLEFVDQGYKVPYDPNVRAKPSESRKQRKHLEGFPRRPNSAKPLVLPQAGLNQEVRSLQRISACSWRLSFALAHSPRTLLSILVAVH